MIKIMIADDMPVYRDYLRDFIDWEEYGFEVCCEARDGREALELYDQYQPDIVLTDIIMPYVDGLELSEKLLKENPDVSIILITGNSEFEYARKAVKLGVRDYIVKPFEKEELIITLLKLQDNISRVLELQNEQDELKRERLEQQFRKLIYAKNTQEWNHLQELGSSKREKLFDHSYYLVATVRIDLYENKVEPEEILKWKEVLISMLHNMLQPVGSHEIFRDFEGNIVTILNFDTRDLMENYEGYEFEDIRKLARERIGFELSVGISDYCYEPHVLSEAYYQTVQVLGFSYGDHQAGIYDYKKLVLDSRGEFYSWSLIDDLNKCLDIMDYERIETLIIRELDEIREYENLEYAMMIYMSLLSILFSYFVKIGRNIDDIFGKGFRPYSMIEKEPSYQAKRRLICQCYRKAIEYQLEHQDTKSNQIAKQARSYIEVHYGNPELSIGDISHELLVNQTYLRRMFKDKYQMTISDFITKIRMEHARELIKKENSKLSYISYEVGYNDTSYFSKCFKKYYGYLPSDITNRQ